jgi:hypothetical protein
MHAAILAYADEPDPDRASRRLMNYIQTHSHSLDDMTIMAVVARDSRSDFLDECLTATRQRTFLPTRIVFPNGRRYEYHLPWSTTVGEVLSMVMANPDFQALARADFQSRNVREYVIEDSQDITKEYFGLARAMPIGHVSVTKRVEGKLVLYVTAILAITLQPRGIAFRPQRVTVPSYCTADGLRMFVNPLPDCDYGFLVDGREMFKNGTVMEVSAVLYIVPLVPVIMLDLSGRPYQFLLNLEFTTIGELEDMLDRRYSEIHGGRRHPPFGLCRSDDNGILPSHALLKDAGIHFRVIEI